MPKRRKSNKEYAIRLVHPDFGEYYFNYDNRNYDNLNHGTYIFMFTQTLSNVRKRKTLKIVEKQILDITNKLSDSINNKILIPITEELREKLNEEIKSKLLFQRSKYYFIIQSVISKYHVNDAKNNIERLNVSLIEDSKQITNSIRETLHIEKDFMKVLKKFESDINQYRKDYSFLEKHTNIEVAYLDIVDASYGFRYLKLKTLREINIEDETEVVN